MKHTKYILTLMVALTTLFSWWSVPALVQKMTDTATFYPLVYYSSTLKDLCLIDFREHPKTFYDARGNEYSRTQYDSLVPMLNFRQLLMNGTLPDTIEGHAVDGKILRMNQVRYTFDPVEIQAPQCPLGVLMEAMPKRGGLSLPGDFFRMDQDIQFIHAETNKVDVAKSQRFTKELRDKGFAFPVKHYWGHPTTLKSYEEGYFCLDSNDELYHLKMVNGRPFVKNTGLGKQIDIRWFSMFEVSNKRFYGFLFGAQGEVGIVESTDDGGYRFVKLDIRPFDITKDHFSLIGDLLYWSVTVTNENGLEAYGLDTETLQTKATYHQDPPHTLWDQVADWLFLCRLNPQNVDNAYISCYMDGFSVKALLLNLVLAVWFFLTKVHCPDTRRRLILSVYLLIAGLPGILVMMLLPMKGQKTITKTTKLFQ